MNFTDRINEDIKNAMKSQDKEKLTALRDIKSKLLLEATKEGASGEVDDDTAMKVLNKLYKQRMESAAIYTEQNREDLAAEELSQAEVIKAYLPEQLSEEQIEKEVKAIIDQTGASSMADMGKVMGMATKQMAGKADGKLISVAVKKLLS